MTCRVHIKSFGCQMNKLDTALVTSAFKEAGFVLTASVAAADVVLINTCSVREHAEQRVFSHLGQLAHIKESRPELVVAIMGCMAQRLGHGLLDHEAVDLVCGPTQIPHLVDLCRKVLAEKTRIVDVTGQIRRPATETASELESFESVHDHDAKDLPGQAFVRVMRGCNSFCTYCVVPYVRGPEASRPPQAILDQVRRLAAAGVRQVTFLGQTVNSYSFTAGEKTYRLADLLEMADAIDGIEWVRFVTSYPSADHFEPILRTMAALPKVCRYLHIPAQSGSDRILKAMNRHYTAAQYLALLDTARGIVPDISLAGDFIVGFPGETEEDFQQTVDLVRKARYKNSFIFKYSPRPGTKADTQLKDDVPPEDKQRRIVELLAVQEQISDQLSRDFPDRTVTVLVEGPSKKADRNSVGGLPQLVGRTAQDWIAVFNGPMSLIGQFAQVRIENVSPLTLFGLLLT